MALPYTARRLPVDDVLRTVRLASRDEQLLNLGVHLGDPLVQLPQLLLDFQLQQHVSADVSRALVPQQLSKQFVP